MTRRMVLWSGLDGWRAEAATVDLTAAGMSAAGSQLGVDPLPYRLDYALTTYPDLTTRDLEVQVTGDGWSRRLRLGHDGAGGWRSDAAQDGEAPLPDAGGDAAAVRGALDCDLALSPLTNTMPVRRHRLAERPGAADFLMAFVSVPDLRLLASPQRYEHVRGGPDGAVVRFVDRGLFPGFTAELELDGDGLAVLYPELARRAG